MNQPFLRQLFFSCLCLLGGAVGLSAQCGYAVTTGTGGFIDISTTGTPLGLSDDGETNIVMPFDFTLFNNAATAPVDLRVGNNGGIIFNASLGNVFAGNLTLPTGDFTAGILPFWDDLDTESGEVYWEVQGAAPARVLIVQWEDRPHFNGATNPGGVTFQAQLYEGSSNIVFVYEDVIFDNPAWDNGASATVGIQGGPADFSQFSFNSPVIMNNMSITYAPIAASGDPTQAVCQTAMLTLDPVTQTATLTPADVDGGSTATCGTPMLSISQTTFTVADAPMASVTLTVTDALGATSTCLAGVVITSGSVDIIPPVAICQDITVGLDENGSATITAADVDGGSTDDVGVTSLAVDVDNFDCNALGTNAVTLTVGDAAGNTSTCLVGVTVEDQDGPTIVPFAIPVIGLGDTDGMAIADISAIDSASVDNCGIATIVVTNATGGPGMFDCTSTGLQTLTVVATDVNGNVSTANVDVMVADETGPTILCNEKQFEETGGPLDTECGAYVILVEPTVLFDNCETALEDYTVFHNGPQDQIFPVGITMLTWTVVDPDGNATSCVQEIEVLDLLPADIYCGGTVFGYAAQNECFANVAIDVPISNICDGVTVTGVGTFMFPITGGQQIITATKSNGTVAVCTLDVAVIRQIGDNSFDNCLGLPDGSATDGLFMSAVGIETFINKSGDDGGYTNFFDKPVEVEGELTEVALMLEAKGLPANEDYYYYVWADFNCDGLFNTGSEFWYHAKSDGAVNTTLSLPQQVCDQVRVRVRVTKEPFDFAYGEAPSGEVEDYLLLMPRVDYEQLDAGALVGKEVDAQGGLLLRPNPATDEVFVHLDETQRTGVELTIVNTLGQEMVRRTYDLFPAEGVQLPLDGFDTGIYFVRTRHGDVQRVERLVVKR